MKKFFQPKFLPLFVAAAAALGLLLRVLNVGFALEKDGLYESRPFPWVLLWIVTILTLAVIFILSSRLKNPGKYFDNFPKSIPGAVGCAAAALASLLSGLTCLMASTSLVSVLTGLFGILCAVALAVTAVCRFAGKKPHFLTHAIPCLYFALRVFDCCRIWSNETQTGVFLFQFLASVCIMLAAYQLCCFDVNLGNRKSSLFWSLSAAYFCVLTVPMGEDLLFYVCMMLWLMTNLCSTAPLKACKPQEAAPLTEVPMPVDEPAEALSEEPEPTPAAEETPSDVPAAEPAQGSASFDEVLNWLDKED